jgi:hypothetical protein
MKKLFSIKSQNWLCFRSQRGPWIPWPQSTKSLKMICHLFMAE